MDTLPLSTPQQFCLRWHNHQTSLLSSLPLLLDQSHLTDITISAENRTVRAHRVVLSACSSFFSELFRTLEPIFHPVVILPGTSFSTLVSLLTFMYSGEVNVFEEQITNLLTLAETLGIKGLADFNGNISKSSPKSERSSSKEPVSPISAKISSPFENFFNKSFQLYPSLMTQPLNFSTTKQSKRKDDTGIKFQINHPKMGGDDELRSSSGSSGGKSNDNNKRGKLSDMRKIDKIAENLRYATTSKSGYMMEHQKMHHISQLPQSPVILKPPPPPPLPSLPLHYLSDDPNSIPLTKSQENIYADSSSTGHQSIDNSSGPTETMLEKAIGSAIPKTGNSKLYATCFICHKQLSNQYNLRVHLETHQNVRYACTVCSHVSRSKDALRKHVSYRHPGTPSPCDSETRRKRSKAVKHEPTMIEQTISSQSSTSSSLQQSLQSQNQSLQTNVIGYKDINNTEII